MCNDPLALATRLPSSKSLAGQRTKVGALLLRAAAKKSGLTVIGWPESRALF